MTRLFIIGIICLLITHFTLIAQTEQSGLFFSSYEVVQDKRTSLNLTPHKPYNLSDGFSLEFDINFRRDDGHYGYIFRIIANGDTNIDLVSNLVSDDSNIWLVYKDEILLSYRWDDLPSIDFDQWVKVKIDFDIKNSRITTSFNEKKQEIPAADLQHLKKFQFYFGICKATGFYSTDVCPMTVKNISIYKPGNKLFRQWNLGKHNNNKIYDHVTKAEAHVENPNWLINKYIKWRKLTEIKANTLAGITPDGDNRGIYIVDDKAIYYIAYKSLRIDTIPYISGQPYQQELRHDVIYNKYTHEIWSYDFNNPIINRFDLQTRRWTNNQSDMLASDYGHHNKFISPLDSSLLTILGYGHYRYKATVNQYNKNTNEWNRIDRSDQITPRYLASAGFIEEDKILVFGGYGSKSGRQELSPRSYYDLFLFNLPDYSFSPLWILPTPRASFVPSETLVADKSADSFYTLLYNNGYYDSYLQLAQYSISQPEMKVVGDSIPFKYRDTETWSYLYLNEEKSDLIAVVCHKNTVSLYAIAYPPLRMADILQDVPKSSFSFLLLVGIVLFVIFCLSILYFIIKKKRHTTFSIRKLKKEHINLESLPVVERSKTSAIYLLGGFQAFNKEGKSATSLFSPTLKQLFLFLFFYSVKGRKGVSSAKLDEILWHDKTGDSARNNRNVNISKLRSILEEVGDITVTNRNSLWKIQFGDNTYCDYLEILELIAKSKTDILSTEEIYRLVGLVHIGELSPNMQAEWMTAYKSDFIKEITDTCSILLNAPENQTNPALRYHIAALLLSLDPLNEEAIIVTCSLLSQTGKRSLAKQSFDTFAKEYEKLMGSPYPYSFNDIIS